MSDSQHPHHHDDHGHADGHGEAHGHDHSHEHSTGWRGRLRGLFAGHLHTHAPSDRVDTALESSELGIRALKISLIGLGATALVQVVIVALSGSTALLADTIHNFGDAATSVPLWIAFSLGRRSVNRRYTYGYGRAEDVAGIFIVLMILASAGFAAYESFTKLLDPQPVTHLWWVAAAAVIGFAGNEAVAVFRMRVGRQIGSAALVADGQHARVDGFTSLAVLIGVIGVAAGVPVLDPLVGLGITVAILFIVKDAGLSIWRRLMDAVEPGMVDTVESTAAAVPGVQSVHNVRVRWLGHKLQAEMHITVDEDMTTRKSHRVSDAVEHALLHAEPRFGTVTIHVDPCGHGDAARQSPGLSPANS